MSALADIQRQIPHWKEQATLACVLNPSLWMAVHGVPLVTYLKQLDQLDSVCSEVQAKIADNT